MNDLIEDVGTIFSRAGRHPGSVRFSNVWLVGTWTAGIGAPIAWFLLLWHAFPAVLDYSDTAGPAYWRTGELVAAPGSIHALVYPHIQTLAPDILAFANRWLSLSIEKGLLLLAAIFFALTLSAIAALAWKLAGSPLAAALAIAAGAGSWIGTLHHGYGSFFFHPSFLLGAWGASALFVIWALWLAAGEGVRWRVPVAILAGLVFNLHATYGLILASCVGLHEIMRLFAGRRDRHAWIEAGIIAAAFLLAASPQLIGIAGLMADPPQLTTKAAGGEAWWTLMAFRKPFHIFLWGEHGILEDTAFLLAAALLAMINLAVHTPRAVNERLAATMIAITVLIGISYVGANVLQSPAITGLVLTRAANLLALALIVMSSCLVVLSIRRWRCSGRAADMVRTLVLMANALLTASPPPAKGGLLSLLVLGLLSASAILAYWAALRSMPMVAMRRSLKGSMLPVPPLFAMALFVMLPEKLSYETKRMPKERSATWHDLTAFLRDRTPSDALVLMPPYPYATASARRSFPVDYGQFGWSVYARWLVEHELDMAARIYGIELGGLSPEEAMIHAREEGGILCQFEKGHVELLSDIERLLALKERWPSLQYAVTPRPGFLPDEWTCGPAGGALLDLKLAYENEGYVIYDLGAGNRSP